MRALSILTVCAVALSGCAVDLSEPPGGRALLSAILPPSSLGRSLATSDLMDLDVGDKVQTFQIELELTPARLALVALTTYGVPIFTLVQEAGEIDVQTYGPEAFPIDPRYVLSDFQIARWPQAALRDGLEGQGLVLREEDGKRSVFTGLGDMLVEIALPKAGDGPPGPIEIRHADPRYRASLRPIGPGTGQ